MALAAVVWLGNVVPRVGYCSRAGGEEGAVALAGVRGKQDKTTRETFWSRWKRHPHGIAGKEARTARADSALPSRIKRERKSAARREHDWERQVRY